MARVFISIGSNIDPAENVRSALRLLAAQVRIVALSTVYRTAALGPPPAGPPEARAAPGAPAEPAVRQPDFYNAVIECDTDLPPLQLKLHVLRPIEATLGRRRTADKYAPRTIDLDILLYGDQIFKTAGLTVPDPEFVRRPFLALALCELAPELVLPGDGRRLREVAAGLSASGMQPLPDYTADLRREIAGGA